MLRFFLQSQCQLSYACLSKLFPLSIILLLIYQKFYLSVMFTAHNRYEFLFLINVSLNVSYILFFSENALLYMYNIYAVYFLLHFYKITHWSFGFAISFVAASFNNQQVRVKFFHIFLQFNLLLKEKQLFLNKKLKNKNKKSIA